MEKTRICDKCTGVCRECCPEHGRKPPPPVMPKPSASAVDWKKRALAAEGKLAGYRRLRDLVDRMQAASLADDEKARDAAYEELFAEMYHLDQVDAPKDFFQQTCSLLGKQIRIARRSAMTSVATSGFESDGGVVVLVKDDVPDAAKLVGLLYQLMQIADMLTDRDLLAGRVSAQWLQTRAPTLAVLLLATGLMNPAVPVEIADVQDLD